MPEDALTPAADAFVGPRPYPPDRRLYGRDRELTIIANQVLSDRYVLLYSPSGAGKSSLLQAKGGVLDRIRDEELTVLPVGRLNTHPTSGGNRYLASLTESLGEPGADLTAVVHGSGGPTLLVIDQFEELLTLDPTDRPAKQEFLTALTAAVENPGVWLLVAMREDHVPALDPYLPLLPTRLRSKFRLDLLTVAAAEQVVERTVAEFGVRFDTPSDRNLVRELVADLARTTAPRPDGKDGPADGTQVEPVFLQVACQNLWRKTRPRPVIAADDLQGQADVSTALREYYDTAVAAAVRAAGASERAVRNWIDRDLLSERGVRLPVLGGDTATGVPLAVPVELAGRYVLRAEPRNGRLWYELAHDRLVVPVRASNEAWRLSQLTDFQRAAEVYAAAAVKTPDLLVGGDVLAKGEALPADQLSMADRAYLEACRAERQRRRTQLRLSWSVAAILTIASVGLFTVLWVKASAEAATKKREELAASRSRVDALIKLAEQQLADDSVCATQTAALALAQAHAISQNDLSENAREILVEADAHRGELLVNRASAAASDLVLAADGLYLAVRRVDDTFSIITEPLTDRPAEGKLVRGVTRLLAVPGCTSILTGSADGQVDQRDLAQPTIAPAILIGPGQKKSPCTALTANGGRAAAGFADGRVALFNLNTSKQLCAPWMASNSSLAINSLVLTPNPITILSDSQDGVLKSWDIRGDEPRPATGRSEITKIGATVSRMAVSPSATFLAVGTVGGGVRLFSMNPYSKELTTEIRFEMATNRGTVTALAVSKRLTDISEKRSRTFVLAAFSNQRVAVYTITGTGEGDASGFSVTTTTIDKTAQYSDAANSQPLKRPGNTGKNEIEDSGWRPPPVAPLPLTELADLRVTAAAFSDDADRLIVGTSEGKALVWDLAAEGLTKPPLVLQGPESRPASSMTAVKVASGNRYALTATADGSIRRWELAKFDPTAVERRKAELRALSVPDLLDAVGAADALTAR